MKRWGAPSKSSPYAAVKTLEAKLGLEVAAALRNHRRLSVGPGDGEASCNILFPPSGFNDFRL